MAVDDALIEPQESIPCLAVGGITDDAEALPGESPDKRIGESGAKHGGVSEGKPLAVVGCSLLGSIAGQKGSPRVAQILQGATPEQQLPAVGSEPVIDARDKDVVIQAGRGAENEACIVETVTGGKVIGNGLTRAESPVEITGLTRIQHGGINADVLRVEQRKLGGCNRDQVAVHVQIPEDSLAH